MTVVVSAFDRLDLLEHAVRKYAAMELVHSIFVVWGNPHLSPIDPAVYNISKRVEILFTGRNSLNDRLVVKRRFVAGSDN